MEEGSSKVPKRKSTSYNLVALLVFFLGGYLYLSNPDNLFLALMIMILGVGILVAGR